jgi:diguanylate cyclase (GGDEF)-like protein
VHVVRRPDGSPDALVGFMFDISERKRTEEQLLALQKELEDLSFRDGLTGLANRRRFDAVFSLEWEAARRTKHGLSLLLVDIDHFKQYNDRHGHVQGDQCLKRVAEILQAAACRPRDFVARYGGEEFVLVLPETDETGALSVAARCQRALATAGITHGSSSVSENVTISIGVGTVVPADEQKLAFIECVDQRLYRAKQRGRNSLISGADSCAS